MPDTTIPIDSDTRDRLRGYKRGGETYSETIERLCDAYDELDVRKFQTGE
jgi:predicted CopG family antitoxin